MDDVYDFEILMEDNNVQVSKYRMGNKENPLRYDVTLGYKLEYTIECYDETSAIDLFVLLTNGDYKVF